MLEEITVLNQYEVSEFYISDLKIWLILIAAIIISFVACVAADSVGFGVLAFIVALVVGISSCGTDQLTGRYRYECTIDESVSMKEVYERYEIIEQRGDIWVLEDKEVE